MHTHCIEDKRGDVVDLRVFCSDSCHQDWCAGHRISYQGWDGCHETEHTDWCQSCGVVIPGLDACEHQLGNVVGNRFQSIEGEYCEHGNTIQQPARNLDA